MSDWKIFGETIEEFMVRWNTITFQLGGLSGGFARKLSQIYINELKSSLGQYGITLQNFFINLSRGGSISTIKAEEAKTESKIKEFYRHNFWGTSIPYTLPIALDMSPPIEGKTVLDIGCGFGRLSLLCALKKAARVVAIDLSEPLIHSLQNTVQLLRLSNLETFIMDAEGLKFELSQFDIIYCCEVIEHLLNPLKTLRLIHSLLKPGGSLILSTPNGLNFVGFKQAFLKKIRYNWISPYGTGQPELNIFNPISLRALLSACNFNIKEIRGSEFLDNLAILYPGSQAIGIIQFLPLLIPFLQKIKNGVVHLGKTHTFKYFGLEMFIHANPLKVD